MGRTAAVAAVDRKGDSQLSIASMLESLQLSLSSAASSLPASVPSDDKTTNSSILPPVDGISLLDTKSEILLSYLQNLVCLILLQVRQISSSQANPPSTVNGTESKAGPHQEDVIKKLTELRVYLERGVRPLEGRLKYQIDKVLKAAGDAERTKSQISKKPEKGKATKKQTNLNTDDAGSGQDSATDDEGSDQSDSGQDEEEVDELTYRPNV
ncbi:hypothetical protein FQN49_007930, partial [Arthroderma sp. PD_2]